MTQVNKPLVLAQFSLKRKDFADLHHVGLVDRESRKILDLTGLMSNGEKITSLSQIFSWTDRVARLRKIQTESDWSPPNITRPGEITPGETESYGPRKQILDIADVEFEAPIPEDMPVYCAGVTYDRSRKGRNDEVAASTIERRPECSEDTLMGQPTRQAGFRNLDNHTVYDAVYDAPRPEIFFKVNGKGVVPNGGLVGIRQDEKESVMEPEFTLILDPNGQIIGYTIGNDMSARTIEGENPLYLPQAKMYEGACGIGPFAVLAENTIDENEVRTWGIKLEVERNGANVDFKALGIDPSTTVGQIKRSFADLIGYLNRCQHFENGVALLTGTGIVPPLGKFSLQEGDIVKISIDGIGTLVNKVKTIPARRLERSEVQNIREERIPDASKMALA